MRRTGWRSFSEVTTAWKIWRQIDPWVPLSTMRRGISESPSVLVEEAGCLGVLTLNKPQKLNALNLDMVASMGKKMKEWDHPDHPIQTILIKGSGRAFCSGGDVKYITQRSSVGDNETGRSFFRMNYWLDYTISQLKKPCVVLMDGITHGGGCGIAMHASYRICTENTLWAMPETKIGYFPDCGSSFVFRKGDRVGQKWGLLYALTGEVVPLPDMVPYGIATHNIYSKKWPAVETELRKYPIDISSLLQSYSCPPRVDQKEASLRRSIVDALTAHSYQEADSATEMIEHLKSLSFAKSSSLSFVENLENRNRVSIHLHLLRDLTQRILECMERASPLSLSITFELLKRVQDSESLKDCIRREMILSDNFVHLPNDFIAGVQAQLIDKNKPKWRFSSLEKVDTSLVQEFFLGKSGVDYDVTSIL